MNANSMNADNMDANNMDDLNEPLPLTCLLRPEALSVRQPLPKGLLVIAAAHAASPGMRLLAAHLALRGPLNVIDAGNRFNVYPVAQHLQRLLNQAGQAAPEHCRAYLARIYLARGFTCHEVTALLERAAARAAGKLAPAARPTLVFDLLDAFFDESIPAAERRRLLRRGLKALRSLAGRAAVIASVRPPAPQQAQDRQEARPAARAPGPALPAAFSPTGAFAPNGALTPNGAQRQSEAAEFFGAVRAAADHYMAPELPAAPLGQLKLF